MRQRTKLQKNNAAQIIRKGAALEVCPSHRRMAGCNTRHKQTHLCKFDVELVFCTRKKGTSLIPKAAERESRSGEGNFIRDIWSQCAEMPAVERVNSSGFDFPGTSQQKQVINRASAGASRT
jgi:hypothetical protein